jgi:alkaline phosphatase
MKTLFTSILILLVYLVSAQARYTTLNAHSHNDYEQKTPFFLAYNAHFGSIEADIWAVEGELLVAHDRTGITSSRTLDSLYLQPIAKLFRNNGGKAWSDRPGTFQLLIDLKTPTEPTLTLLVNALKKYPDVFNTDVNKNAISIVITGNRPGPSGFRNYPPWISFDGNVTLKYDDPQLKRVGLFSENLEKFTSWNGKTAIAENEEKKLMQIIDSVHGLNKKIRFWNAPDNASAWRILMGLKVDYINTDHIQELTTYLETIKI